MSVPPEGYKLSYTVTNQTERDQIQPGGPPVPGVMITYRTGLGNSGSVWVPYSTYNRGPEAVAPLIAEAAGRMDQIGQISQ